MNWIPNLTLFQRLTLFSASCQRPALGDRDGRPIRNVAEGLQGERVVGLRVRAKPSHSISFGFL